MRTIYTAAAYWSWVLLFLVWLPGYFLSKPAVRTPHRGRHLVASVLLVGAFAMLFSRSAVVRTARRSPIGGRGAF